MSDSVKVWVECPVCLGTEKMQQIDLLECGGIIRWNGTHDCDCLTCDGTGRIVAPVVEVEIAIATCGDCPFFDATIVGPDALSCDIMQISEGGDNPWPPHFTTDCPAFTDVKYRNALIRRVFGLAPKEDSNDGI